MLRELFGHLAPRRRKQFIGLAFLMLAGAFAELVTIGAVVPFITLLSQPDKTLETPYLQQAFSALGWNRPGELLLPITLMFVGLVMLSATIRLLLAWASKKYVYSLGCDFGTGVYQRLLNQPYSYHVRQHSSNVLGALSKAQAVAMQIIMPLLQIMTSAALSIAILAALLMVNAPLAMSVGVIFALIYVLVSWLVRQQLVRNGHIIARAQSKRIRAIQEGLGAIRDVILDGSQAQYSADFARIERDFRMAQVKNAYVGLAPRHVVEALGIILLAGVAYWYSLQPGGVVEALPVIGVLVLGAQRLLPQGQQLYSSWSSIVGNRNMLADLLEFLNLPAESSPERGQSAVTFADSIEFQGLGFRYQPDTSWIFKNVDIKVPKGANVAICGQTGIGKSTLVDILMGLIEPTEGRLLIDGVALTEHNRAGWQRRIAHVPQSIYLTDASIARNIGFGTPEKKIDMNRVEAAARSACLAEFINTLPHAYRTEIGERGVRLSGGQRQRIGIARALYKDADVLVLDEATNALDPETEAKVLENIKSMAQPMTVFVIAHRGEAIEECTWRIDMESGRQPTLSQIRPARRSSDSA